MSSDGSHSSSSGGRKSDKKRAPTSPPPDSSASPPRSVKKSKTATASSSKKKQTGSEAAAVAPSAASSAHAAAHASADPAVSSPITTDDDDDGAGDGDDDDDGDGDEDDGVDAVLSAVPASIAAPVGVFDQRPPNLVRSFCFWNNKGGVGKTTLSVQTACGLARGLHPVSDTRTPVQVLFVDLCPQANASQFLLGGSRGGEREASALANALPLPRTVGGYLGSQVTQQNASLLQLDPFISRPHGVNYRLRYPTRIGDAVGQPLDNLHLLAGDPYLELAVQVLIGFSDQVVGLGQAESNWVRVMNLLRRGVYNYIHARPSQQFVVFIDTNPSFAVYTQIAAVTAELLICPIAADVSSKVGINGVISLLYGHQLPVAYEAWGMHMFSTKARQQNLVRPRLALVVHNRTHDRNGKQGGGQYDAMVDEITQGMKQIQASNPNLFVSERAPHHFRAQYMHDIVDMPAATVGSSRWGQPIMCVQSFTGFIWQKKKKRTRSLTAKFISGSSQKDIVHSYMTAYAELIVHMCEGAGLDFKFGL